MVASCDCLCHLWCIVIHVHLSTSCTKESCGKPFNQQWCIDMGYKLMNVEDKTLGIFIAHVSYGLSICM